MKTKKVFTLVLALALIVVFCMSLAACGKNNDPEEITLPAYEGIVNEDYSDVNFASDFKFGLICLHGEESTYDKNFIDAARLAISELGLSSDNIIIKTNVAENEACVTAAEELVEAGCDVIFADRFFRMEQILACAY